MTRKNVRRGCLQGRVYFTVLFVCVIGVTEFEGWVANIGPILNMVLEIIVLLYH